MRRRRQRALGLTMGTLAEATACLLGPIMDGTSPVGQQHPSMLQTNSCTHAKTRKRQAQGAPL